MTATVTLEELLAEIQELRTEVAVLRAENAALKAENASLKAKLNEKNKDSTNSHNPSSKDDPSVDKKKKKKYPGKPKSNKNSGAQPGHNGSSRPLHSNPDEIVEHAPGMCSCCGHSLEAELSTINAVRQEVDLPQVKPIIREHRTVQKTCSNCGHINIGKFPKHIRSLIQFGLNVIFAVIYFNVVHHIPFQRTTKILSEMFGLSISEGSIENILQYAQKQAKPYYDWIQQEIQRCSWLGSDETSIKVNKQYWWRWVWQNLQFTLFVATKSRAYEVIEKILGQEYLGILLHDCYGAQNKAKASGHQLCFPHLLRDLAYCIQIEGSMWAYKVTMLLIKAIKADRKMWQENFDENKKQKIRNYYTQQLNRLLQQVPSLEHKHSTRLWKRLNKNRDRIFTFMKFKDVPADNNGSERAFRNAKIHRKISGCFRNELAAQRHCVLLSVLETCKKQGFSMLEACRSMVTQELVLRKAT